MTTATDYLSCAETAKLVRAHLKAAFPAVKFSVRSSVYSGGASIDVSWTDGPRTNRVKRITDLLEGATFDGMVDLKSYHDTVLVGPAGPRSVHLGADFIFHRRHMTNEADLTAQAAEIIRTRCATEGTSPNDRFGNEWVNNLARAMVLALDFEKDPSLQETFKEVVLRETPDA